jgi:hypothetical protein
MKYNFDLTYQSDSYEKNMHCQTLCNISFTNVLNFDDTEF